jgi:hypothetical protein
MRTTYFLPGFLFLIACLGADIEYHLPPADARTYWADPALDQELVDEGATMLEQLGLTLTRVSEHDALIHIKLVDATAGMCGVKNTMAAAWRCGDVWVCPLGKQNENAVMYAHELAHVFGVKHTTAGPAIMNPTNHPYMTAFTEFDVAAFEARDQSPCL